MLDLALLLATGLNVANAVFFYRLLPLEGPGVSARACSCYRPQRPGCRLQTESYEESPVRVGQICGVQQIWRPAECEIWAGSKCVRACSRAPECWRMTSDCPPLSEIDGPTWSLLMEVLVEPRPTCSPSEKKDQSWIQGETLTQSVTHLSHTHLCAAGRIVQKISHMTEECWVSAQRWIQNTDVVCGEGTPWAPLT